MSSQPQKRPEPRDPDMNHSEPPESSEQVVQKANEEARRVRDQAKNLAGFVRRKFTPPEGIRAIKRRA